MQTARGKQSKGRHSNDKESKAKKNTAIEKATSVVGQIPRRDESTIIYEKMGEVLSDMTLLSHDTDTSAMMRCLL